MILKIFDTKFCCVTCQKDLYQLTTQMTTLFLLLHLWKRSHPTLQVVILNRCGAKFCSVICQKDDNVNFATSSVKRSHPTLQVEILKRFGTKFCCVICQKDLSINNTDDNVIFNTSSVKKITSHNSSCDPQKMWH